MSLPIFFNAVSDQADSVSEALVPKSDPEDCPCAVGSVLRDRAVRSAVYGEERANSPTNSLVPQELSDLLRCFGSGAQGVMGAGGDFLRVTTGSRHAKSLTRVYRTANRCGLLRGVNG